MEPLGKRLPTGKQMFVEGATVDPALLTSRERDLMKKRKWYYKNKEKILADMRAEYKEGIENAGGALRPPGRPRKYPAETYV